MTTDDSRFTPEGAQPAYGGTPSQIPAMPGQAAVPPESPAAPPAPQPLVESEARAKLTRLRAEIGKAVVGQDAVCYHKASVQDRRKDSA